MKAASACHVPLLLCCLTIALGAPARRAAAAPAPAPEVPAAEREKIRQAAPQRPSVPPQKPRRLLVFSRAWGYWHTAIPYGRAAFEILGSKTGAYQAVLTDELDLFEPGRLEEFDAVLFNNTNNEIFLPEKLEELPPAEQQAAKERDARLKRTLAAFLRGGKGLVVIHAGVASFRQWPEFGDIMGARFDNHPWNAGSTVTLKVEEASHPLTRAFPPGGFQVTDEIYQFTSDYSRRNLRVLLSLDTARSDMKKGAALHRTDGDFALAWVKSYGQGRVFYCALGHQHDIFWNPAILRHYLDGIQFALGDLPAASGPRETP